MAVSFRLAAVALAASLCASLAACSGSSAGGGDGGAGCPSSPPSEGATCFLASGTTCSYGGAQGPCGGGTVAVCMNGTWAFEAFAGAGTPAATACPSTIPQQGSPCSVDSCGGAQPSCSYGCDQGGPAYATCNGSTWQVQSSGIACAVDAAVEAGDAGDAGASCHTQADCGSGDYCQAPGGPYLTGYALGQPCASDATCSPDAGMPPCNGVACVCQSTQYSPRPLPGQQGQGYCMAPCLVDADCAASPLAPLYGDATGFVCGAGGHCVPRSCSAPADCPADFDCSANQCVRRSCATDGDCAPSGTCVDGACYPAGGTCQGLPA